MNDIRHKVKTTCKFCRREFESFGLYKVCPDCDRNMESYFQRIKDHLNEFPDASIADITEALGIPSALIKFYLKEDRLALKNEGKNFFLKCELCDKPINSGRYCQTCEIVAIRSEMQGIANPDVEKMNKEIAHFQTRIHTWRERR